MRTPRLRLVAVVLGPVLAMGLLGAPAVSAQEADNGGLLSDVLGSLPSPTPTPPPAIPAPTIPVPAPQPVPGLPPPTAAIPAPAPKPPALPPESSSDARPGPGRAWTLTGSALKLGGSHFRGVVERDIGGRTVRTLHFTVDRLEITDLVQRGDLGNGKIVRAAGSPGSVSTVTNGPIELYTQELTGTLAAGGYPLVRTTLSADSLAMPNLDLGFLKLPDLTFNDVVVHNTDLSGGTLTIPGSSVIMES